MAKAKSEDKRNAILAAAIQVFAERGLTAPTFAISQAAGLAEGTLFTYFRTKDDLVNAVYLDIKTDLADAMMSGFPRRTSVRHRFKHVWNRYLDWGIANPLSLVVVKQVEVWSGLTEESKLAVTAPFVEIQTMANDAVAQGISRNLPGAFLAAAMSALAETAMKFMQSDPQAAESFRQAGFDMIWAGIVKKG